MVFKTRLYTRLSVVLILVTSSQLFAQPQLRWGVSERQGRRPSMEDAYLAQPDMRLLIKKYGNNYHKKDLLLEETDNNYALFGIFDGHGGDAAAKFAANYLPRIYAQSSASDLVKIIQQSFNNTHTEIIKKTDAGTTALVALLRRTKLYLAWAGDARAVLEKNGAVAYATVDHKPSDAAEKAAIEKRGGLVMYVGGCARVDGQLAVARALGDRQVAEHLTSTPDVHVMQLNANNSFLILACDGIGDVLSNQEAVDVVRNALQSYKSGVQIKRRLAGEKITEHGDQQAMIASRALIDAAYNKGSKDNLSALVVLFDWDKQAVAREQQQELKLSYWQWLKNKIKTLFGY